MEFEVILGSLLFFMLFNLFLYIRYMVIAMISMGGILASMRRIRYGIFLLILRL
jgi:hypothetical protein